MRVRLGQSTVKGQKENLVKKARTRQSKARAKGKRYYGNDIEDTSRKLERKDRWTTARIVVELPGPEPVVLCTLKESDVLFAHTIQLPFRRPYITLLKSQEHHKKVVDKDYQNFDLKKGLNIATPLKIAMLEGQDASLLADVPREQGQGATLKKAPKIPKEAKQDMIVFEGSSHLNVHKSGQAKKLSGTAGSEPLKTQVNKRKAKADVKEKEGTAVPEQQNVKRLKRMKGVEVREAIKRKLVVDEVKVKGHTCKGQLEKVPEVKIALKRDGVKNKAKKHVEKVQEDEGPADKALALVGSSKRPKLQEKRAKQSGASCTTSTIVMPYVEVINGGNLVRICRAEPPCVSRNTLMEKRSRMIQHLKKVHGLNVFIPQRLGGQPRENVNNDVPKSSIQDQFVANHMKRIDQREETMKKEIKSHVEEGYKSRWGPSLLVVTRIKATRGSSGGSHDDGDEDDESSQDGSGDDDTNYGSNGDANDDDGGSDISGGSDDNAVGDISGGDDDDEDDRTDDEDDDGGSGKGDCESVSEHDDAQDVSSDEDEVQEILSSPASIIA
ncbi:hypothetical protein L7F22_062096 [Adiantum nelumboides]|nr:hypothetical protein [Adiantum nelumboides]